MGRGGDEATALPRQAYNILTPATWHTGRIGCIFGHGPVPLLPVLSARPRGGTPILPVLLLALVLAGVLAYQAHDAARSHRRVSEAALRDYARFAAWELGRAMDTELSAALSGATMRPRLSAELDGDGADDDAGDRVAAFAERVREALAWCRCSAARDFFLVDLATGTATAGAERLPEHREWLREELLPRARERERASRMRQEIRVVQPIAGDSAGARPRRLGAEVVQETRILLPDSARPIGTRVTTTHMTPYEVLRGPGGERVLYTLIGDARGGPRQAYGFWLDAPALATPVLDGVLDRTPLLPPSLLRGAGNREALALTVTLDGDTLASGRPAPAGAPSVADTVETALGALVIVATVRPEMAGRLVIGGLPRSRLPWLLGVFVLTLALVGIAILQVRRRQELMRLRSDFISGVSHELRTPLAQIRLFSDLLGSGRLSEAQRGRSVGVIGEEARRLTFLVENILHFSRGERRGSRVAPVPLEVAPLLREIVESFAPLARSRDATLEVRAEEGIVAPLDRDAIRQVLLNLLDNAVKYGPPGQRVTVGAEVEGARVRIRVDDEGPGVPPAERERVWEPYRRLARDVESATGGSGIGLAVVRELVTLHGGRASVVERPGGGARFLIEVPLAPAEREAEVPA